MISTTNNRASISGVVSVTTGFSSNSSSRIGNGDMAVDFSITTSGGFVHVGTISYSVVYAYVQ